MREEQHQKLKEKEIEILSKCIDVCSKLEIPFFLMGGTLLGAVRHGGFIPWDDDIDIGMYRSDYERFLREAPAMLPEGLFLQTYTSDPGYLLNFAKLRDSCTTFIQWVYKDIPMNHGVYIDIFPLDYYPDDTLKGRILLLKKKCLDQRIMTGMYLPELQQESMLKRLARKLLRFPYRKLSLHDAMEAREKLYTSVKESGWLANYGGAWGRREVVPAKWFAGGHKISFEGMEVLAPQEYDKWLTQVYGDYMTLPPEEKRVSHHGAKVIDLERPYTEYMKLDTE